MNFLAIEITPHTNGGSSQASFRNEECDGGSLRIQSDPRSTELRDMGPNRQTAYLPQIANANKLQSNRLSISARMANQSDSRLAVRD
ncbi:Uu.00g041920.m01.CDS01 [Anthostomella pinea]|uniref:Uu.00g041920.m01.CDS01 n=1 Tax=Anthostomella pinea TaxID=933095 RepID=A0AAI8VAC7_9PEZI|nr:Uu.00g041920.m01.CDS01 [Anthostomella pinea]